MSTIYHDMTNNEYAPWVEKYRPSTLDDLVLIDSMKSKIGLWMENKEMPHVILTGVPGVGKTSTVLCLIKNLLGENSNELVLACNAADERGVKAVQESIQSFCKKKFKTDTVNATHKIILLDEADSMTKKALQMITSMMDEYYDTTRFAFTCNDSSKIIESVQSRCTTLRFMRHTTEQIAGRLKYICESEGYKYNDDGINTIIQTSRNDLRQSISKLQLICSGMGEVTPNTVLKLCDIPNPDILRDIFTACINNELQVALTKLMELIDNGYSASDISMNIIATIRTVQIDGMDERIRMKYATEVNKMAYRIGSGLNTTLQLTGCISLLATLNT